MILSLIHETFNHEINIRADILSSFTLYVSNVVYL